jgi:hypothetical protein
MDGDPAVESQLDTFSRILPLPYRVALIIVMGMPSFPFTTITTDPASQAYGRGA